MKVTLRRMGAFAVGFLGFLWEALEGMGNFVRDYFAEILLTLIVLTAVGAIVYLLAGLFDPNRPPCSRSSISFECKDSLVRDCLNSEKYTRDECIALVGGGKTK